VLYVVVMTGFRLKQFYAWQAISWSLSFDGCLSMINVSDAVQIQTWSQTTLREYRLEFKVCSQNQGQDYEVQDQPKLRLEVLRSGLWGSASRPRLYTKVRTMEFNTKTWGIKMKLATVSTMTKTWGTRIRTMKFSINTKTWGTKTKTVKFKTKIKTQDART